MYKTILVKELIEDGEKLLQELDRQHFPITAALWYDSPERQEWNLYIVSEVAHEPGLREAIRRVREALAALKGVSLSLDDIVILSPQRMQFQDLRRTIEGVSQMSVTGERVNLERVPMQDAYVYRWSYD
jgi:hypothetical protein